MAQDISSERQSETSTPEIRSTDDAERQGHVTGRRMERREVRSEDPKLSPRTNERLTAELQEAVGAKSVEVPKDRPHATQGERMSARSVVTMNRVMLAISLAFLLTVAAIIALLTGSWWLLAVAAAAHAIGTTVVVTLAVRITRGVEHPSPTLAAAMNEEGIVSADHRFSEMVEEFKAPEADDLSQWANERTVRPQDDPATASVEQSRSWTPTSQPSQATPEPRAVDVFIGSLALAFSVVSVMIPLIATGGWLWLTPAVVVPLCAGLVTLNTFRHKLGWWTSRTGIVTVCAGTIVAVAVFCVLVAVFVGQPSGGS